MRESEKETEGDINSRVYELGYLLVPTLPEADTSVAFGNLKELVLLLGGITSSDEMPKMLTLAYPMVKVMANLRHKFKTAYFGWIKFTMDSNKILELKKHLDLDSNFIRFLILKTVKENTIAAKRFMHGEVARRKIKTEKTRSDETTILINKEEIDKEIDALVAA